METDGWRIHSSNKNYQKSFPRASNENIFSSTSILNSYTLMIFDKQTNDWKRADTQVSCNLLPLLPLLRQENCYFVFFISKKLSKMTRSEETNSEFSVIGVEQSGQLWLVSTEIFTWSEFCSNKMLPKTRSVSSRLREKPAVTMWLQWVLNKHFSCLLGLCINWLIFKSGTCEPIYFLSKLQQTYNSLNKTKVEYSRWHYYVHGLDISGILDFCFKTVLMLIG